MQLVLRLGYEVVWSAMDTVWLKDFLHLAPRGLDYVGVDDSVDEDKQVHLNSDLPSSLQVMSEIPPSSSAYFMLGISDVYTYCVLLQRKACSIKETRALLNRHWASICVLRHEVVGVQMTGNPCTGLMYFHHTQRAMSLLAAWHQMCLHMNLYN